MNRLYYLDADTAYLLGCIVAHGELINENGVYKIIISFPRENLIAEGENLSYDTEKEVGLGIVKIRERLAELLDADIRTLDAGDSWSLIARMTRKTMAWRNITLLLGNKTSFPYFEIPTVFFDEGTPRDFKKEFLRGYADVAGNIRPANRDQAGRHRVRLDVLNYATNWKTAIQLCILLQDHLDIPVPLITWGHPNLGREWREHQLNVYAEDFLDIGFYFDYKQAALQELANLNIARSPHRVKGCPGARRVGRRKPSDPRERDSDRLPPELANKHFNAYWQICRALGCPRRPRHRAQLELMAEE